MTDEPSSSPWRIRRRHGQSPRHVPRDARFSRFRRLRRVRVPETPRRGGASGGLRARIQSSRHSLRSIFDPPAGLFLRGGGGAELLDRPAVAIVGARACSPYGPHVARTLGRGLAAAGLVVVSGLARGVDGEAHRGALEAGG